MNIIVCIKQVPGTSNVKIDPETGTLIRSGIESKMNPNDLYALETAIELKERYGGTVHAVTMGPNSAKAVLHEAIQMGADRGTLISDRAFAGADVLATAYTISQCIKALGNFDLIICGKQTTDGDTAQVGPEISEFLNVSLAANVTSVISVSDENGIEVKINLDEYNVTETLPLPCLICTDSDINTPRLPSYKRMIETEKDETLISVLSLADFADSDKNHYGLTGSATSVEKIFPPETSGNREMFEESGSDLAQTLFKLLQTKKFI